jgi:hypothetical protein
LLSFPKGICFSLLLLFLSLFTSTANAHVGSKDVFETVTAGPYTLYVTIRPPNVIPGVAAVEVRSSGAAISSLLITPLPVTGEAAKHPPAADTMQASAADPAFFTGAVWMMASGTWQVRFEMDGAAGRQVATVPVLAVPVATLKMEKGMGLTLALLGLFLIVSMAGVVAAAFREARLRPGIASTPTLRRAGAIAAGAALVLMTVAVFGGAKWWNAEAATYAGNIYAPPVTSATLAGNQLDILVQKFKTPKDQPSRSTRSRSNDDYLLDHGKIMHLYAIREPGMDAAFHLHPTLVGKGDFRLTLPVMPPGHYKLYGDVVHKTGFPETLVTSIDIPAGISSAKLDADDASATPASIAQGELGLTYKLPSGYTMVWDRPAGLTADTAYTFHFKLLDPEGKPATGMEPYLGMAGHAAFVKTDGTVFAHTHPEGSAAMADVMLANESTPGAMSMTMAPGTSEVSFPYGFPTPGRYRIFIQMKHNGTVETGVFDATVN